MSIAEPSPYTVSVDRLRREPLSLTVSAHVLTPRSPTQLEEEEEVSSSARPSHLSSPSSPSNVTRAVVVTTLDALQAALKRDGASIDLQADVHCTEDASATSGLRVPAGVSVSLTSTTGHALYGDDDGEERAWDDVSRSGVSSAIPPPPPASSPLPSSH